MPTIARIHRLRPTARVAALLLLACAGAAQAQDATRIVITATRRPMRSTT